ncbi:hypothetical protein BJ322DRAFT_1214809 [Thelephora terrestris]|uniref:F-box domain-containing protein n=1 Tax=Thelephora terrestris TaxID=56493 RepID=A0A9P6L0M5_9AGAM|nr:hypothetical protein BJ322DRAFT_1214809 [Thelephora terrestris]
MSDPRLPPELLDYIFSFLHNDIDSQTLKKCCLVAKSWIPRARKRLFGVVWIPSRVGFEAWWRVFPDPDSSPGHYTRSLIFQTASFLFSGVPGWCSLVRPFSNVVRLEMRSYYHYGFETPTVASSKFFEFICSFPLLEDLLVAVYDIGKDFNDGPVFQPRASPPLTGTLGLRLEGGVEHITRGLLALSNGIRFKKFVFTWRYEEDHQWGMALVERCSDTLESFGINLTRGHSSEAVIDLSKATKLRQVAFVFETDANWITNTLNTILPEHRDLQKILIYFVPYLEISPDDPIDSKGLVGEEVYKQWMDLDGRLAQLWEAHAVRTKLIAARKEFRIAMSLLPEIAKRGILQLVTSAEEQFYSN